MRRKIFLCLAILLVLIIGRAAWVFYTFDEQSYVQSIQAELEESLGLRLQVQGPVRKSVFPRPRLFLSQISCYAKNKTEPVWTASEVVFQTNWKSLLKAYMRIYHVEIINPKIHIDVSRSDESHAWTKAFLSDNDFMFKYLKSLFITNGTITYQTRNKTYHISQLNGRLFPPQDDTLIHWEGAGIYHDLTYSSTFLLKQAQGESFPWSLTLNTPDKEDHINLNGQITAPFTDPHVSGSVDIASTDIGDLLSASDLYRHLPKALETPLRLSAEFNYTPQQLMVKQVALRIGKGTDMAHLAGSVTYTHAGDIQTDGVQAQIYINGSERFIMPLLYSGNFSTYSMFQWLKNQAHNLKVHIDAENTSLFNLPVTRLGVDVSYKQPDIYLKNLSIQGLVPIKGEGVFSVTREDSALDLSLQASISNVAHFARQYPLAFAPYVDLAQTFPVDISCNLHNSRSQFALYNLKMALPNQAVINGEFIKDEKQGTSLRLNFEKLNAADFISYFDFKQASTPLQALHDTLSGIAKAQIWNAFPLHLELMGHDVSFNQAPIKSVQVNADIERQRIKINQFAASLPNDIDIQDVKGELQKDVSGQVRMHELHYQITGPKLADLGITADVFQWIGGPATITGILNGTAEQLQTSSSLKTADLTALYEGIISQKAPYYDAIIQASSPSFEPMARILWKRSNPFTLLTGRTEFSSQVRVDDEHMALNELHIRVGDLQLDGHANLAKTATQYITLSAPQLDMHLFYLPEVKDILHMKLSGLKTWDIHFETPELTAWNGLIVRQANAHLLMKPTQWNLLSMTGVINHGEMRATGQLQKTENDASLTTQIQLKDAHLNNIDVPPMQIQSGILSMNLQLTNPQVDDASYMQGKGTFTLAQTTVNNLNIGEFMDKAVRQPLSQQFKRDRQPLLKALISDSFVIPSVQGRFEIDGATFSIPEFKLVLPDATLNVQASGENKTLLGTLQIVFVTPTQQVPPPVSVAFAYGTKPKTAPQLEAFYDFLVQNKIPLRQNLFSAAQRKKLAALTAERKARADKNNKERADAASALRDQIQDSYKKIQKIRSKKTFNETAEGLYQQLEAAVDQLDAQLKVPMTSSQLSVVQQQTVVCTRLMRDIRRAQEGDPVFFAQLRTQKLYAEATALFKTLAPLYRKHPSYQNEHFYKQAQQAMSTIQRANSLAEKARNLENVEDTAKTIKAQIKLLQQIEAKMQALSQ